MNEKVGLSKINFILVLLLAVFYLSPTYPLLSKKVTSLNDTSGLFRRITGSASLSRAVLWALNTAEAKSHGTNSKAKA